MQFNPQEIAQAKRLRDLGLPWQPQPGHFVWDEARVIAVDSPFQERVYFILDLKHFLRRVGSIAALQAAMVWLPTWHDARALLRDMGVSAQIIAEALQEAAALQHDTELITLYHLIATELPRCGQGVKQPPVSHATPSCSTLILAQGLPDSCSL